MHTLIQHWLHVKCLPCPPLPPKKKKKKKEKSGVLGDKTPHMQHIVKMLHTGKKDATIKKKK